MFQKIERTAYPPAQRPILIWDGSCTFCAYWITRWQKITGARLDYEAYHTAASRFPDIALHHFKEASRLIDTDGRVYSGPQSAYRSLGYAGRWAFLASWYEKYAWFRSLSDRWYQWIARHRNFMFRLTRVLWGSDPENLRPFWVIYLALLAYIVYIL